MRNNLFPITIIDGFYPDPDSIVDFAKSQKYAPSSTGAWPGVRSESLQEINSNMYDYFCKTLFSTFYNLGEGLSWHLETQFHTIEPRTKDKYDPKNCGWLHTDGVIFGGLVYLTKDPEEDTGTDMFLPNKGHLDGNRDMWDVKRKEFTGQKVSDEEYLKGRNELFSNYTRSVKIENVYNRCILFGGNVHHSAETFGSKNRLTQVFFCYGVQAKSGYPNLRIGL